MSTPFRWKSCSADVLSNRNGSMARAYMRDVVEPSLGKLDAEIQRMAESHDDPAAVFGIGPARDLLRATTLGYCLALQSLWEKQLRSYLRHSAQELKAMADVAKAIQSTRWHEVEEAFHSLRGVPLSAFDEYRMLTLLHLLGNVCRHGNGWSVTRLVTAHPELWPQPSEPRLVPPISAPPVPFVRSAENLQISVGLLNDLAGAIDSFWREIEYIYHESIESKDSSLESELADARRKRAGRGRPWDPPAGTS